MDKKKEINLIEGPILRTLVTLAIPIMASSFLNTVYSITDMAWIGMLGSKAVAGIGVGGIFVWFSQGLSSLARMGGQVLVAQNIGKGEKEEAGKYAKAALQLVFLFGLFYGAMALIFTKQYIGFFNLTDSVTIGYAKLYLRITSGLIVFNYLMQVLIGIYTAQGDSKTPLKANALGLLINMVLDPVLILGIGPFPRLEIVGAAMATVSAQFIATTVMIVAVILRKDSDNVLKGIKVLEPAEMKYYKNIARIGGPTAIQGTIYPGISMILARMSAVFGAGAVAVQRLGGQLEAVSWNTADGFAAAINAFSGQNYGAGELKRAKKGYWISFTIIGIWGVLMTLIFTLAPRPLSEIFFFEEDVIQISINYMVIVGLSQAFMCIELMTIGALSGLGKTKLCSIISVIFTAARIPIAYYLSQTSLGLNGIWIAFSVTSILKGIVFTIAYIRVSAQMNRRN